MSVDTSNLDSQIERLRQGDTLSEHEVKALCDQVSIVLYLAVTLRCRRV